MGSWSLNTNYCYRVTEALIQDALAGIESRASGGRLDLSELGQEERELVFMYNKAGAMAWQSVCLVLRTKPGSAADAAEAVAINRPYFKAINPELAHLLLNGAEGGVQFDGDTVTACARAFGREAA